MIQPLYLNFSKMISERLFRIPLYQRHYSWAPQQRRDLFDDIITTQKYPDRDHFMATVVCLDTGEKVRVGSESLSIMEIVDGQQRLTTLVLLLKAIEKDLSGGTLDDEDEARLLRRSLSPAAGQYIILQTNHDSSHIFEEYLRSSIVPDPSRIKQEADQNIQQAILECEDFVVQWKQDYRVVELLSLVKNRFYFILQLFEDEQAVYTIFEVLNSRGLPVDFLDKCKSMLMGALFESSEDKTSAAIQLGNNHKLWGEIFRTIGIRAVNGSEILSFAATLHTSEQSSRPLSEDDSLSYFRRLCTSPDHHRNIELVASITIWLLKITDLLVKLHSNPRLRSLTEVRHARLLAIAIMTVDGVPTSQREQWLRQWEITTFRIYGVFQRDSRYSVGEYVRLAQQISKRKIQPKDVLQSIADLGKDYPVDEAIKLIAKQDCYNGWEEELRYILRKYEEHLCATNGGKISESAWEEIWSATAVKSIEHIYPQGEEAPKLKDWKGKIPGGQRAVEKNVHRIGNLLLLTPSLNSQAGQKSFADKREIYKKSNLSQAQEVAIKAEWSLDDIEQREHMICDWIQQEFSDLKAT